MNSATFEAEYDHRASPHSVAGASATLRAFLGTSAPVRSVLDIGCGQGEWLVSARQLGIEDVFGVDGHSAGPSLRIPRSAYLHHDLNLPLDLARHFDLALCLEVGEHLRPEAAESLVSTIVAHSDLCLFSAACPGQPGQRHINCQWPAYWQRLFNDRGFVCVDDLRWAIWSDASIEPWYRQNIFVAQRNSRRSGNEARILPVVHPAMLPVFLGLSRALPAPVAELVRWARARLAHQKTRLAARGKDRA
jgi:SAM-dependent methyltransferase